MQASVPPQASATVLSSTGRQGDCGLEVYAFVAICGGIDRDCSCSTSYETVRGPDERTVEGDLEFPFACEYKSVEPRIDGDSSASSD